MKEKTSSDEFDSRRPFSEAFPESIETANAFAAILARYSREDACMAVFCINSFYKNRSARCNALALNAALSLAHFGNQVLNDYEDFEELYNLLSPYFIINPYDDYIVPVLGHTRIEIDDNWYPALYGCGLVQEYAMLCFANPICDATDSSMLFRLLLEYVENMAFALDDGGWDGNSEYEIAIHIPPSGYFERTRQWFSSNPSSQLNWFLVEALSNCFSPIEKRHFLIYSGSAYPLFNASLLLDFYAMSSEILEEHIQNTIVNHYVADTARSIFLNEDSIEDCVIAFPAFERNGELHENVPCTFMTIDKTGAATFFFDSQQDPSRLPDVISALEKNAEDYLIIESKQYSGQRARIKLHIELNNTTIVEYFNNTVPSTVLRVIEKKEESDCFCGALDLLSILHAASSVEEINAFFIHLKSASSKVFTMFSGLFPYFLSWKGSNRNVFNGAEDREGDCLVVCNFNDSDEYYVWQFLDVFKNYPVHNHCYVYGSPYRYIMDSDERGFTEIRPKKHLPSLGSCRRIGIQDSFVIIDIDVTSLVSLSDSELAYEDALFGLIKDLISCYIISDEQNVAELALSLGGVIKFSYRLERNSQIQEMTPINKTFGLKAVYSEDVIPTVYFSVCKDDFKEALNAAENRSVECALIISLIELFPLESEKVVENIRKSLSALSSQGKKVDLSELFIRYHWQFPGKRIEETAISRASAVKMTAFCADKVHIGSGRYFGKGANQVIRKFQSELTAAFHKLLNDFCAFNLIEKMVGVCAVEEHEFKIHTQRFNAFSNMDSMEEERINRETVTRRESSRRNVRAARYCIETVLAFDLSGKKVPSDIEMSDIFSLALQMLSLSDIADMLFLEPKGVGVEILDNKIPIIIEPEDAGTSSLNVRMRSLGDSGHELGDTDVDTYYFDLSMKAFEKDTGVSFGCLIEVLMALSMSPDLELWRSSVANVVVIKKDELKRLLKKELGQNYEEAQLVKCLDYLTLRIDYLKCIKGKELDYLPFGRVKDRPFRLELQPIIPMQDDNLIFSPVSLSMLSDRWIRGISQRFLPVKTLPCLNEVIMQWKAHYEKALERDVYDVFISHGFNKQSAFHGLELHKKGKHPIELGDYDGLAFDARSKRLWIIECKEFEKIETYFDYMQLQQRWFGVDGDLLKFERRINYAIDNSTRIVHDLGLGDYSEIEVIAYLVCNKLFVNLIGDSSFTVVTLNELNSLLDGHDISADLGFR